MNEWAARLLSVFPERSKENLDEFILQVTNDQAEHMYYQKEYDADIECRPSFEQISHDRILHEAGKNLSILKALENVVTDRLNGFNAFSASRSRPPSYELLENVGGSLRLGLDSLFVYAEQEQLQSRQQLFLSDLRKSLTQMRLDASRRVSDYQREINSAEKEVGLAEKKLHKSKEQERGDYKSKLESFELDVLLGTSRYKKEGREHRDRDRDRDRQEEAQSRQLRHEREVKDDVRALLRAIEHRDQVLSASRRAFQKLHGECHRAAQLTLRRVSEKEREMQDARMEALEKLERCVGGVDVDTDECNFIHACGGQGALALSSQALSLLGDLMPQGAGQGGQGQGGLQRVLSSDSLSSKNSNASPDHSCPTSPTALTPPVPPAAAPTSTPKTSSTSTSAPTSVPTSGPGDMYVTINSLRNLDSVRGSQDTHSADTHTQGRPPSPHSSIPSATSPPSPPSPTLPSPSDQSAPSPASRPTRVSGISIVSAVSAEARRGGGGDQGNNGNQGNRQGNKADLSVTVSTDRGRVTQADFTAYLSQIFYTPGNTPAPAADTATADKGAETAGTVADTVADTVDTADTADAGKVADTAETTERAGTAAETVDAATLAPATALISAPQEEDRGGGQEELDRTAESIIIDDNYFGGDGDANSANSGNSGNGCGAGVGSESGMGSQESRSSQESPRPRPQRLQHASFKTRSTLQWLASNPHSYLLEAVDWIGHAIKTQSGRDAFTSELNQFRSRKVDVGGGFEALGAVLWTTLGYCQAENDIHNAKVIMMLSQTFYRKLDRPSTGKAKAAEVGDSAGVGAGEGGAGVGGAVAGAEAVAGAVMETETEEAGEGEGDREGEREFVKEFLLEHPVWRDGNYWEQALWQCAIEQLQSIPCPCPWYDMDWDERKQAVRRVHEVLFSQVMAITHSMLELGCSQEQTREFLYRMCVIHQLSESMRQHLLKHVNKNKGLGRGRDGGRRGSGDGDRRGSGDGDRRGSGDGDGRRSSGGGDRRGSGLGSGGSKGSGGSGSGGGGGDGIWSDSDALDVVM